MAKKIDPTTKPIKPSRFRRAVDVSVRFDYSIPDDVPASKIDMYIWEKTKRLCKGISKYGLVVTPTVPREYQD
jgi:hypothetical protein